MDCTSSPVMKLLLVSILTLSMIAACKVDSPIARDTTKTAAATVPDPEHEKAVEAWRKERLTRLTEEFGWLTLVGLHWLKEGDNHIGSKDGSAVHLPPSVPADVGALTVEGDVLTFTAAKGVTVTHESQPITKVDLLRDTQDKGPTKLQVGTVRFYVIERGGKLGVRVKDSQSAVRTGFKGLNYFPVDTGWRKTARFEPHTEPKTLTIQNVLGDVEEEVSPGSVVFMVEGKEYRLDVTGDPESKMFIVFKDTTANTETYGAGRFIYTGPVQDGKVELDFNQAYNPPCAFTAFSTCPLPPKQNRLPVRVEAGEKKYH